jgi:hypothetical protein
MKSGRRRREEAGLKNIKKKDIICVYKIHV